MAVTIPSASKVEALDAINAAQAGANWKLCLYKNDYTIVPGTTPANLTEADFSGYARITIAFGAAAYDGGTGKAVSTDSAHTFAHNGGATANNVYGWYALDVAGAIVLFGDRLPVAPKSMSVLGDTITVTLTDTLTQG